MQIAIQFKLRAGEQRNDEWRLCLVQLFLDKNKKISFVSPRDPKVFVKVGDFKPTCEAFVFFDIELEQAKHIKLDEVDVKSFWGGWREFKFDRVYQFKRSKLESLYILSFEICSINLLNDAVALQESGFVDSKDTC